jgi:hypothetical protein
LQAASTPHKLAPHRNKSRRRPVRRLFIGLISAAVVITGAAVILWSNSTPPARIVPPAPPQAAVTPPPAPAAPAPVPSFDIVKVDPSGHAVIAGRAAPGAKVAVLDGDKTPTR